MDADNPDFEAELWTLLAEGRKIDAIKRYREQTGAGLAEAKQAVEALERGEPPPAGDRADSSLEAEVLALLEQGRKIKAVKLYREQTGVGLKEAKDAVEAIGADRRIVTPSKSGCLGVVLLLGLVLLVFLSHG